MFSKINLQVDSNITATSQILSWFEQLNHPPFSDHNIWWQCQTLLQEGFTNTVEHAHKNLPRETLIELEAVRSCHFIEIRIWSFGIPFDLKRKIQETQEVENMENERGRGLKIMSMIANEMSYEQSKDGRYCLYMKKHYTN